MSNEKQCECGCGQRERVRQLESEIGRQNGSLARAEKYVAQAAANELKAKQELASERSRREKAEALTARWREAAIAFQALNTCYRIGRTPSEKLFSELEKGRALMTEDPKP